MIDVAKFVELGPIVARLEATLPMRRPTIVAMKPATCSCLVAISLMEDFFNQSNKSKFSSLGSILNIHVESMYIFI